MDEPSKTTAAKTTGAKTTRPKSARSKFAPLWLAAGGLSFVLGAIGAFLPVLPTVPFMLLATFCFARSSPRLHGWLINHKTFGPPIRRWEERGAISPKGKMLAILGMSGSIVLVIVLGLPRYAIIAQSLVMACVAVFILTRPNE